MIRLFKHYVPKPLVVLGIIECLTLIASITVAWRWRLMQFSQDPGPLFGRWPEILTYAAITYVVMLAVGLYQAQCYRSVRISGIRLAVALLFSFIAMSVIFFIYPDVGTWRSVFVYTVTLSFISILSLRYIFSRLVGWHRFRRRVLVLGAGRRAKRMRDLANKPDNGFEVYNFVRMAPAETDVGSSINRDEISSLADYAEANRIEEIIVALQERRGSLPVAHLLDARLRGIRVTELTTFLERETGRVDLDALNPSWMIFADGFAGSHVLGILTKRLFDIVASGALLFATAPVMLIAAVLVKTTSPGPIFYRQERVGQFGRRFMVLKFRSMRQDAEKDGRPQWAQKGDPRVTTIGRIIRSTRIDELPQIFNVFRGDMSFVGPRPERPFFVEELVAKIPFFNERHIVKPGITGWAQLNYPYGASEEDSRHKLEYDLYYVKNYSVFLDLLILIQTVRVVLWQDGVR